MGRKRYLVWLLLAPIAMAQDSGEEGVFEPGVQHVCVPTADGTSWDCKIVDASPERTDSASAPQPESEPAVAATPAEDDEETPPPPPFLAEPRRDTPYALVPGTIAEPDSVEATTPAVVPSEASGSTDSLVGDASEPLPAEPEPMPNVEAPPTPSVSVAASAAPPDAATAGSSASIPAALGDAAAFARLPPASFTLQLAYATTPVDFPRLVAELGLDPASCYVLRVRGANGPMWLLAHGVYPDVAEAKTAQQRLPRVAGLFGHWPRRIGALQAEITQGR